MVQAPVASINGVALHGLDAVLSVDEVRQRACSELLRQAAVAQGLLASDDGCSPDGVLSEAASGAIEALLEGKKVVAALKARHGSQLDMGKASALVKAALAG
jgi:hypothetical protein